MHKFDDAAAKRVGDAVRELEERSAAEMVVEIRSRSGSYAHADARFAAALALVSLVVLVFMPLTVPPVMVLVDSIAVYFVGIAVARHSSTLRRLFTTRRERTDAVQTHAAAQFHHRGVANTSGETGVLVFVSLLEQRIEVMADRGVLRNVAAHEWNATIDALRRERTLDVETVLSTIRRLAVILARDLPAGEKDIDELASAPEVRLA